MTIVAAKGSVNKATVAHCVLCKEVEVEDCTATCEGHMQAWLLQPRCARKRTRARDCGTCCSDGVGHVRHTQDCLG